MSGQDTPEKSVGCLTSKVDKKGEEDLLKTFQRFPNIALRCKGIFYFPYIAKRCLGNQRNV